MGSDVFGMTLRQLRGGRTRAEYGRQLGVTGNAIRKIERGESLPSWPTLARIFEDGRLDRTERAIVVDQILASTQAVRGCK